MINLQLGTYDNNYRGYRFLPTKYLRILQQMTDIREAILDKTFVNIDRVLQTVP